MPFRRRACQHAALDAEHICGGPLMLTVPHTHVLQCLKDHGLYESQAEALLREEVLGRLHSLMLTWIGRVAEIRGVIRPCSRWHRWGCHSVWSGKSKGSSFRFAKSTKRSPTALITQH